MVDEEKEELEEWESEGKGRERRSEGGEPRGNRTEEYGEEVKGSREEIDLR